MSPRSRPPGKTFKERWPQDAEETRYFAATSYAVVLGGVLGVLTVPFTIGAALSGAPAVGGIIIGALVVIAVSISRATATGARWLALAWKIGAWLLGAAALGLVVESAAGAMCDQTCRGVARRGKGNGAAAHVRGPRRGLSRDRHPRRPVGQRAPRPRAAAGHCPIMARCRRSTS
jgi:hypothetical protein